MELGIHPLAMDQARSHVASVFQSNAWTAAERRFPVYTLLSEGIIYIP